MSLLELKNLTHHFGQRVAIDKLNLSVEKGELVGLLGSSGCGKTTTIRLIAGLLKPTAGEIWIAHRNITEFSPERRNIGMVFQSYALFPHLNVFENVAFGLRATGVSRAQIPSRVRRALNVVHLSEYESRPVFELSGGEQQRVAIARAIILEPQVLLLDEPLSNLDASLREQTRNQLRALIRSLGITTLFVTHDQEEAFAVCDRIVLLSQGKMQQAGTPQEIYDHPRNAFVARFVGRSNLIELQLKSREDDMWVFSWPSGRELRLPLIRNGTPQVGRKYSILFRPEKIEFEQRPCNKHLMSVTVSSYRFAGAWSEWQLEGEGIHLLATKSNETCSQNSSPTQIKDVWISPEALHVFDTET